jgi:EAL domain-containing protein (putative c-di-GMP-specific phosphodiesterase class I)
MRAIAEGIETPVQLEKLRNLGCDFGQSYLFSRPLYHVRLITYLKKLSASPSPRVSASVIIISL